MGNRPGKLITAMLLLFSLLPFSCTFSEMKRIGVRDEVSWSKKPIGQRALELSDTKTDKEILEILHKEYGKEQLDEWLSISKPKEKMKSVDTY